MKNPWTDMILFLPLQEFMSLTSVQGKLRASAPCYIFYVDSLCAAWTLHQVPHKLLHPSIYIELMVAITSTIPLVSPPLSLISTLALSVPSSDVVMGRSPTLSLFASTNKLPHARSCDDSLSLARPVELCGVCLEVLLNMYSTLHMILPLENKKLSILNINPVKTTFLFASFLLKVSKTIIPLDYSILLNKLCIILHPQTHLLDSDSSPIQPPLHPSRSSNMLNLLHISTSYERIIPMPKRKFQCSMAPSFDRLRMARTFHRPQFPSPM
ncbi:hypothetical protein B296_00011856 [Ensete ventricosum]|uniref:Uncharacterized protein n=1 Tax=Ensete ventricosum TaxID=4639 RepID=A0A427A5M7_ENSVE|nr:hypothetical protein B296_00011856 [Ensete ventricosum]